MFVNGHGVRKEDIETKSNLGDLLKKIKSFFTTHCVTRKKADTAQSLLGQRLLTVNVNKIKSSARNLYTDYNCLANKKTNGDSKVRVS